MMMIVNACVSWQKDVYGFVSARLDFLIVGHQF